MPDANTPRDDDDDAHDLFTGGCTPSYAGSCAQQGLPRTGQSEEILIEKTWEGKECTDGVWEHETRGRGDADEDDEKDADHVPDNGHTGHFGVFAGN
mgnify:CR=1 FL=1